MLNVGFDNYVNMDMVKAISGNPSAGPMKKIIQNYKNMDDLYLVDFTSGKKVQSIVFLNDKSIVLSAITAKTLKERYKLIKQGKEDTTSKLEESLLEDE